MQKEYPVSFEVAGPAAMFTRPDTGASFVSYPAPTYSACKGLFEAIARLRTAFIRPTKVEICAPVRFERYMTNYGGPLRKANQVRAGNSYQLPATVLVDVCYRIYGRVEEASPPPNGVNHLHALQEMFNRRLAKGQSFHTPCLGWKEFVPSYFGPFRDDTGVEESVNFSIPSMLFSVWDRPVEGDLHPEFRQDVKVEKGVLVYAK